MNKKYNNYCIYSHNLSDFDGVFLLKHLTSFVNKEKKITLDPLMKDSKMINLLFKFNKYSIKFRDSYLMFPKISLEKLS
jgi:DNA polymerase type B, organellar and viral